MTDESIQCLVGRVRHSTVPKVMEYEIFNVLFLTKQRGQAVMG